MIYGTLKVDNAELNIAPGTKIYFHNNSGMIVENDGNLNLNGTLDKNFY